jgi:acetylornithine deacetylase/succinyl-diaminopimelate desuccinylase-like protein
VISDTSMRSIDEPAILHSLRGMTYIEVEVAGPQRGPAQRPVGRRRAQPGAGAGRDPGQALQPRQHHRRARLLRRCRPLTEAERAMIAKTDLSEAQYRRSPACRRSGATRFNIRERISARPTLDINGLWSGWSGPGPKTIIPAEGGRKLSSRLVGNQDPHKIFALLKSYIESITPPTVTVEVRLLTTGKRGALPLRHPGNAGSRTRLRRAGDTRAVFTRGGGSIPVVADIADLMAFRW